MRKTPSEKRQRCAARTSNQIRWRNRLAWLQIVCMLVSAALATPAWSQSPPPNDSFANSIPITGTATNVTGSNVGATKEPGEPQILNTIGGKSVWWTWIAPTNGTVTVDTIGSSFDTLLGVYTGNSVSALVLKASNDDSGSNGASRVSFTATAGASYQIMVDGYNPGTSPYFGRALLGSNTINASSGFIALNIWEGPQPPVITTQPHNLAVTNGAMVAFSVAASGAAPFTYQWFKDTQSITNATNNSFSLASAQSSDSGSYSVVVSNVIGSAMSSNAVLTVAQTVITSQPKSLITGVGFNVSLQATALAIGGVSYQWQKEGKPLSGSTNSILTLSNVQAADSGNYTLIASNSLASATSSVASVTILPYTFTTLCGLAGNFGSADGMGSVARFLEPSGIALDQAGNIYVSDWRNCTIRKITPQGMATTIAGVPQGYGTNDGPGVTAEFAGPEGLLVDAATNIYVCDNFNHTIRKITPDGMVSTFAGKIGTAGWVDGNISSALFNFPTAITMDGAGSLYVVEYGNGCVRKITADGMVTTVAGNKQNLYQPVGIAVDNAGNLFVPNVNGLTKISPTGVFSNLPSGLPVPPGNLYGGFLDGAGNYYIAGRVVSSASGLVQMVTPDLVSVNLAGATNGALGSADGLGHAAMFNVYRGNVAVDPLGNIYVADSENATIRKGIPLAITNLPVAQAVPAGNGVNLSAGFGGQEAFSFQWLLNNVPLSGQTNSVLTIGDLERTNSGVYSLLLSNAATGYSTVINSLERALVPPVFSAPQVTTPGTVQLKFQDSDGGLPYDISQVQVLWRSNLPGGMDTNWQVLSTGLATTNGFAVFTDTNTASQARGFYRVVEH